MSHVWMNGWHVMLDASALGSRDMDSLGLFLFLLDFIICSFYKVYGEDQTGFGCIFVKKYVISCLQTSSAARGIGMVKIVPICKSIPPVPTNDEIQDGLCFENLDANVGILEVPDSRLKNNQVLSTSFSGPISPIYRAEQAQKSVLKIIDNSHINKSDGESFTEIDFESETRSSCYHHARISFDFPSSSSDGDVNSFKKRSGDSEYERSSLNQEILEKLADKSNISLAYGVLKSIWFQEKYEIDRTSVMGDSKYQGRTTEIPIMSASLGFVTNFEDVYKLWDYVAKFLDAYFVEKQRWRYKALNQKTIEL
ncbi:hypothetical protein KI387_042952 [Taxus chinensis]|uniref:Uncharacterized protein n=2 Tax=Taxus chinensis TaxID=29808 RepID=A0AA38F6V6_TAXCH|nr:hypothetical protein KI387_042952 [Taxus chinensis]